MPGNYLLIFTWNTRKCLTYDFLCAKIMPANIFCCILTERELVFLLCSKDNVVYTYRLLKTHSGNYTLMVNAQHSYIPHQRNAKSFSFSCSTNRNGDWVL